MAETSIDPNFIEPSSFNESYLKVPHIEELIDEYEKVPNAWNLCVLVSSLLALAFDPKHGWDLKYDHDEKNNHTNFYLVKVDKKPDENVRTVHTVIKVILNLADPFPKRWDHTIPDLETAPMLGNRCWAIIVRGLEVRLTEYHRDEEPGLREIPCDFTIDGQIRETVHIRNNPLQVNCIINRLPSQWPQPLTELERIRMATQARTAEAKIDDTALSGESYDPPSEAPTTPASEVGKASEVIIPTNKPTNVSNATEPLTIASSDEKPASQIMASQSVAEPKVENVKHSDQPSVNKMATQLQGLVIDRKNSSAQHGKVAQHEARGTNFQKNPSTSGPKPKIVSSNRPVHRGEKYHQPKVSSKSAPQKKAGTQGHKAQPSKTQPSAGAKITTNGLRKGDLAGQAHASLSSRTGKETEIKD